MVRENTYKFWGQKVGHKLNFYTFVNTALLILQFV